MCVLVLTGTTAIAFAQHGTIQGKVVDRSTGEALMFATVMVLHADPPIGTETDLDGRFELHLPAGTYELQASYIGFPEQVLAGVRVVAGQTTVVDFFLESQVQELGVVEVAAERVNRSEVALIALRKRAPAITDNLSAQEMARFGSSNAAESVKRVAGASLQDGRYIVVRGLGDRYSSARLNGMPLPGNDPYRNSVQLDLIPTHLLDNLVTSKTFTPDMPGNFTGGSVNLNTKSFPEEPTVQVGFSTGYNTQSSLRRSFLTHRGGRWDWLGYDDGTRQMPEILGDPEVVRQLTPSLYIRARNKEATATLLDRTARALNSQMAPEQSLSLPDYSFNFSLGNQYKLLGHTLGVWAGGSYRRTFRGYARGLLAYEELTDPSSESLNTFYRLAEARGTDNPQVGAMAGLAYKFGDSQKISYLALYHHDTEKLSQMLEGEYPGIVSGGGVFQSRALLWRARSLQIHQLAGEHVLTRSGVRLDWGVSVVRSKQDEPDFRQFANTYKVQPSGDTSYFVSPAEYDLPYHFFRALKDRQQVLRIDVSLPLSAARGQQREIKIGALYRAKQRDFADRVFQMRTHSPYAADYQGDPDWWFGPDNVGIIGYDSVRMRYMSGLYVVSDRKSSNQNSYGGHENIGAAYAMADVQMGLWRFVGGLRLEHTDISVQSRDTALPSGTIRQLDLLPAVQVVCEVRPEMHLRASFARTLARPNMRELAPFTSFDFIGGFRITGNPELERTLIQNFDLRWEMFPHPAELLAVSAYYKSFVNPIGKAFIPEAANPEIKYVNVSDAAVYGLELELRKRLTFLSPSLERLRFQGNFSYIRSVMAIPEAELDIVRRFNPEKGDARPFPGQSPWLINAGFNYFDLEKALDVLLSFHMYGPRLSEISEGKNPDVYEQAFPQLDFSIRKGIGTQLDIRFAASNLLDAPFRRSMTYKGREYLIQEYRPGVTFSLGIRYRL